MKFFFAAFFLSLICANCIFSLVDPLPKEESAANQFIQWSIGKSTSRGLEGNQGWAGVEYQLEIEPFTFYAGLQTETNLLDITTSGQWLPLMAQKKGGAWRFGLESLYHFQNYRAISFDHDFLLSAVTVWKTESNFSVSFKTGILFRASHIPDVDNLLLTYWDLAISTEINKKWSNGLELFFIAGSYNNFRFPLFYCPQWTLGAAYNFTNTFRVGCQAEVSMPQFWMSVAYVNLAVFKLNMRVSF